MGNPNTGQGTFTWGGEQLYFQMALPFGDTLGLGRANMALVLQRLSRCSRKNTTQKAG